VIEQVGAKIWSSPKKIDSGIASFHLKNGKGPVALGNFTRRQWGGGKDTWERGEYAKSTAKGVDQWSLGSY